jgi:hypothetical protein
MKTFVSLPEGLEHAKAFAHLGEHSVLTGLHWPGREFLRPAGAAQKYRYHPNHVLPREKSPSVDWSLPISLSSSLTPPSRFTLPSLQLTVQFLLAFAGTHSE